MLLNKIEFFFMTSPLRSLVQKYWQAPVWKKIADPPDTTGKALEIGCGRGTGIEIILNQFKVEEIDALDLDPRMVDLAKQRLKGLKGVGHIWVEDATHIFVPDAVYDFVFDFGAIHHIPDWRRAVAEVCRVLKPGGLFYSLEILKDYINSPIPRMIFKHPLEDRFEFNQFRTILESQNFSILGSKHVWNWIGWFVARKEIFGVVSDPTPPPCARLPGQELQ